MSVGPATCKNSMKNELILETDDDEMGESKDLLAKSANKLLSIIKTPTRSQNGVSKSPFQFDNERDS